ncbi:TerC family protein [Nonomuraea sp. 10N515B]|uniref:TerC family protein n=1 Tax=Nonomuraea sp. 10N515B TaxID=3457422 RepID=UPI003FCECDC4
MGIDSAWAWFAVVGIVLALFVLDFMIAARRPHAVGIREAALWSAFYVAAAVVFGLALWPLAGAQIASEYISGWPVEKSLSVDNLFVFVIILTRFEVPDEHRQKALLFGIAAALALRAVLISVGAAAITLFSPTFLLFGLILLWTAIQLARHRSEDPDVSGNPVLRWTKRTLPATDDLHGGAPGG